MSKKTSLHEHYYYDTRYILWIGDVGHFHITAQLLLEQLFERFGVVATNATLGEDLIFETNKELSQVSQRHLLVDEAESKNPSSAGAHDHVKQLGDPLVCHPLELTENLDLNETSHSATVQAEDPVASRLRAKLNGSSDAGRGSR